MEGIINMLKINKSMILVTVLLLLSISVLYGLIDRPSSSSVNNNSSCATGLDCTDIDKGIIRVISPLGSVLSDAIKLAGSASECSEGCIVDLRILDHDIMLDKSLDTVTNLSHPIWVIGEPKKPAVMPRSFWS